jgi:hypothetical protein
MLQKEDPCGWSDGSVWINSGTGNVLKGQNLLFQKFLIFSVKIKSFLFQFPGNG